MSATRRSRVAGAVAVAIVIALLVAYWRFRAPPPRITSTPFTEMRLTSSDDDPVRVLRSQSSLGDAIRDRRRHAELQEQVKRDRSPRNLHRLALARFAVRDVRAAEELLAEAAQRAPDDAAILTDLAAAELALGEVADAAEHSARAFEREPKQAAAAFNWALALEKLSNRPAAIDAWERYLRIDPGSGWADEARRHLARLRAPRPEWEKARALLRPGAADGTVAQVVRHYPQRTRGYVQFVLLPAWAASGNPAELALLRRIAARRAAAGDPFLHDVVEHAATKRDAVAEGLREFGAARLAEPKDMKAAGDGYRKAADLLHAAGSPLAVTAAILTASARSYGRSEVALTQLVEAEQWLVASRASYPSMASELAWVRGMVYGRAGLPHECLEMYRAALAHAHRGGEIEHEAALAGMIATQLENVADPAEAEQFRRTALRRLDGLNAESRRMYVAYLETATGSWRAGRPRLALAFLDAAMRIGVQEKNAMYLADGEAWRAVALHDAGRTGEAMSAIASVRAQVPLITTADLRDRTIGNAEFITGRLEAKTHPERAITAFSASLAIWKQKGSWAHLASIYLVRGETFLAIGDRVAAERDFRAAIEEMETQRRGLGDSAMRISYFERADRVFVRLIELLIDDGRVDEALSVVERKRARVLLEQIAADTGAAPLQAKEVARGIDSRTSLLEITLLDRGAELWLVRSGRVVHGRGTATRAEIEAAVARHLEAIAANDLPNVQREGRWLFDQLVAPVLGALPDDSDLVIVPDGVLQAFPFATLVQPNGHYLFERQPLAMAPSASVFLRRRSVSSGESVLVVAQPAPEGYDRLPGAAAEAAVLARSYSGGQVLIGGECDPARFMAEAENATLVHYTGHGRTDVHQPSRSALMFESASGAVALSAQDVGRARLKKHPLVVLAACSTGRGRLRRNEGVDSLASAFLQAGARGVVATLWDVEDGPAEGLFRSFHRNLRGGARPADALRETQLSLLHGSDPRDRLPSVWGSTVAIGTF